MQELVILQCMTRAKRKVCVTGQMQAVCELCWVADIWVITTE